MFVSPNIHRCSHLTLAGARCTYPALHNKEFCYDHHYRRQRRRSRRTPVLPDTHDIAGPLLTFVYMEDYASVIANINETALAFSEHSIDHRQVSSLTYLMNTALKTLDRMRQVEKIREQDMPTAVAYDDCHEPIAAPEPAAAPSNVEPHNPDHASQLTDHSAEPKTAAAAESAPANKGSAVVLPESATADEGLADEAPGISEASSPLTDHQEANADPDHSSQIPDHAAELDDAARLSLQLRDYDEMHRRLNPHIYRGSTPPPNPPPNPSAARSTLH